MINSGKYENVYERRQITEGSVLYINRRDKGRLSQGLGERNRDASCLCRTQGQETGERGFRCDRISGNKLCILAHLFFSISRYRVSRHLRWVEVKIEDVDTDVKTLRRSLGVECGLSGSLANEVPILVLCPSARLAATSSPTHTSTMCTYPSAETDQMHALIHPAEGKRLLMNNPNITRRRAPEDSLKFTEFMNHRRCIYHSYR